jgi:hypothetical protein
MRGMRIHHLVALIALSGGCKIDHGALPGEKPCDQYENSRTATGSLTVVHPDETSVTTSDVDFDSDGAVISISAPDGISIVMRQPQAVGIFTLEELGARACEMAGDAPCTAVAGSIEVDSYDPSCASPDDTCSRMSARIVLDGPAVLGSITLSDVRSREVETCSTPARLPSAGCDCRGAFPGPGQL